VTTGATTSPPPRPGAGGYVSDEVGARLEVLRRDRRAPAAADSLWNWVGELGAARDRRALDTLFEHGRQPRSLDGVTDGMLVTTLVNPLVDLPVWWLTRVWMPWRGKVFDATSRTGTNRLSDDATLPVRLVWPLYRPKHTDDGPTAFEFVSGPEPGRIPPRVPVLKIDYEPVRTNPRFVIRRIRDELVELGHGVYLGRVLFRVPTPLRTRFVNIGYFALRKPAGADQKPAPPPRHDER
jgi:hypothetical protein